jgi:pimeloyl-ACP methyl ester carboxylesterase
VRTDAANPGAPVVLATGGPGSNGLARTANIQFVAPFAPILANHDWVFFSQRGTEHAKPQLDCPEYKRIPADAALNGWPDEERRAQRVPAIKACVDRYTAESVDLSGYNSNENAADIASIKEALGYDKIILYGQSYGTQLAQFVMRNHPDILEAVILDGVVPVGVASESAMHAPDEGFRQIFDACAADAACNAAYPNAETALREAYAALEANPQPIKVTVDGKPITTTLDGTMAVEALFNALYGAGEYALAPYLVTELRNGNYAPILPLINSSLEPAPESFLMHFAINCADDPNPEEPDPGSADVYADINFDDDSQYSAVCPVLNVQRLPDSSDAPLQSDIPTLVISGALDPVTPPANGDDVSKELPNSYDVVFSTDTHINGKSHCGVAIMNAFISDPTTAPDSSCAQQPLAFEVPQTVTASSMDGSATMTMTLPPGFRAIPNAGYASGLNLLVLQVAAPPLSPGTALQGYVVRFPGGNLIDGEPIAGYPSKQYHVNDLDAGSSKVNLDFYAFSNDVGTYVIFAQNQDPSVLKTWRTVEIPAILKTVKVSGQ